MVDDYPLFRVETQENLGLGRTIWHWACCNDCTAGRACNDASCQTSRRSNLGAYRAYYKKLSRMYVPEAAEEENFALRTHDQLHSLIKIIRAHAHLTRREITENFLQSKGSHVGQVMPIDQHRAVNLAVRAAWMINCSSADQDFATLERDEHSLPWRSDSTFADFLDQSFPKAKYSSLANQSTPNGEVNILAQLSAKTLQAKTSLRFRPTDDIRDHLRITQNGCVQIFHQLSFIKECLTASRSVAAGASTTMAQTIANEHMPRQIALEVLNSIQLVLFPSDRASTKLLRSLVAKESFNQECLTYDSAACRRNYEDNNTYQYFGARLMDLYEEMQNPKARKWFDQWMESRSGPRFVMKATIIGIIIAIALGVLSLGLAGFQTWIAWQQWQHPVEDAPINASILANGTLA